VTGANLYAYVLRIFKRTNFSTEAYEAITDTVRDMKRRFDYDEARVEKNTTTTITVLGTYSIAVETDFGSLIGDVIFIDGSQSQTLNKVTKEEFDRRYPNPVGTGVSRGRPVDYCIFGGKVLIGPAPDSISYRYHYSYTSDDGTAITSITAAVPFSATYPEILRHGVLERLFGDVVRMKDEGLWHGQKYEGGMQIAERRERKNTGAPAKTRYRGI
jgi:hypothetical protein